MEQYSEYLMWVKRKNNSWEEKAFLEDGQGPLGGFVWPPRSYSCSFCRREFRSAQALGGHMNVHRRERAKHKQSLNTTQQNPKSMLESTNPSFLPIIDQESTTLGSNSDTRSCVCDESLVLGSMQTNLYLGFDGSCDDEEVINCKRQKIVVSPIVVGSMEDEVDLELRLAT